MQPATSTRRPLFAGLFRHARRLTSDGGKLSPTGRRRRTGSDPRAVVLSTLPAELWIKVFEHIPNYLLLSVTLTCRAFRALAQPLLFASISTHPEERKPSPGVLRVAGQTARYRKRVNERTAFFFSPQICHAVRVCRISLPLPEDECDGDDLVDHIFAMLPHLPNLRALECRHIRLTPLRLHVLRRLELPTMSFDLCFGNMADLAGMPSMPLREVTFKYSDASIAGQASPCPVFLSPDHLETLHATTTRVLDSLASSRVPFTRLRTLELPGECLASRHFIAALARCPEVENIALHATDYLPQANFTLPDGVLPHLRSYRGPHHFAAAFLRHRTAEKLEVSVPCRPASLESSLAKLYGQHDSLSGASNTLRSLSFPLTSADIPAPLLGTIHVAFPMLSALAIPDPALSSSEIKALLNAVPAHYALTDLTLRIQGRDKFNLWIPPAEAAADAASCFGKVRLSLVKTYPSIRHVRFLYGSEGASLHWERSQTSGLFVQVGQ
ncbi:hypothetical protein MIND_01162500 [Mycena indigotica]|uniref:F-box domain-containing protein n=1 Tax=Mycena indigotica TaxID=2126181 RepID=A0A8H6S5V8_9AGAR|nr:uncharacterized protein MIND_01162500 [Mycena indigotica]KAF7292646.1 hypothetical protein MIND_01162500 [Mycena indigotica]